MPWIDVCDLLEIMRADQENERYDAKQRQAKARTGGRRR